MENPLAPRPYVAAILVAAGSGRRMGFEKTLLTLAGEPLIRHAVRAFDLCDWIDEIFVVTASERLSTTHDALGGFSKPVNVIAGGETRQESVMAGVSAIERDDAWVAVHDGARPLLTDALIRSCVQAAWNHGAAAAAERVTDTLQRADADGFCFAPVDRDGLWRLQTPQVARRAAILDALNRMASATHPVTDETTAFTHCGMPVMLVENSDWNFKVTLPRDVPVAEFILRSRSAASLT